MIGILRQSRSLFGGLLLVLVPTLFFLSPYLQGMATGKENDSRFRVLMIGVNEYKSENVPDLRGALNDIEKISQVLISRYFVDPDDIEFLTDEGATRNAILDAIQKIVDSSGPDDFVYIHFSGHGSQVEDLNGDEGDEGLDETIVPHDGRTPGIPDITDDEIADLLKNLKTSKVLIVFDSCHSGTATRDLVIRTRMVPQDTRTDLYESHSVSTRGVVPLIEESYVLMTGAASHQSALDGPVGQKYFGFFSYAFATSLEHLPRDSTPQEIYEGVLVVLNRIQAMFGGISMPEPQLEGPEARMATPLLDFYGDELTPESDSVGNSSAVPFDIETIDKSRIRILDGVLAGAVYGSYWALFPRSATALIPEESLAVAFISGIESDHSIAAIRPQGAEIPSECLGLPVVPPPADQSVPVRLEDMDAARSANLGQLIQQRVPNVIFVSDQEFSRFIVTIEGDHFRVLGLGGLQTIDSFVSTQIDEAAENLARIFQRSANASSLLSLNNPVTEMVLRVKAVSERSQSQDSSGSVPEYRYFRSGEEAHDSNSLMLYVRASDDCYLTIVDVDTQGRINLLFPNDQQRSDYYPRGRVPGNKTLKIPDSFDEGNAAGFLWNCGPPAGVETIQVFACVDLNTAETVRQAIRDLQTGTNTRSVAGNLGEFETGPKDPFAGLRRDIALNWTGRGFAVVGSGPKAEGNGSSPESEIGPADWTTSSISVLVKEN